MCGINKCLESLVLVILISEGIMTKLEFAIKRVELLQGKPVRIKVNEGRKKYAYYDGYIDSLHPAVFTFKTVLYGAERTLSYSYVDVLAKTVMFSPLAPEQVGNLS